MIDALERFGDFRRRHFPVSPLEKKVRPQKALQRRAVRLRWLSIKELERRWRCDVTSPGNRRAD
jgi:hypothetical protein